MRDSFLPPIPELEMAADLLDQAASAALAGDHSKAKTLISKADIPAIWEFTYKIIGPLDPSVHWQYEMTKVSSEKQERTQRRMPSAKEERAIFLRDGWRCRYCGCRVVSKRARKKLIELYPAEARWGKTNLEKHCALGTLTATADHIIPHSRGGGNEPSNLVTSCVPCNFGRNSWTLEEVGFSDPRERAPVVDQWDGLMRLSTLRLKSLQMKV